LVSSPIPKNKINIGYKVTTGIERNKSINPSSDLFKNLLTPIINPIKTPSAVAIRNPENTRFKVYNISLAKLLWTNKLIKALNILAGEGKRDGSSKLRLETICQTINRKTKPDILFKKDKNFLNLNPP